MVLHGLRWFWWYSMVFGIRKEHLLYGANNDDTQVGTLEGTLFLQSGNLVRLSQQALVDCRYICHHDDQHHHHDQHHHRVR